MRPIPSANGYSASSDGKIWCGSRELPQSPNKTNGYLRVNICRQGMKYAHRLVAETFHGPCPEGMQCRHLNGSRTDNRAENLRWATKQVNEDDKREHGTTPLGERNPMAKLTASQVAQIRDRAKAGELHREIANSLGIARCTVTEIVSGRKWKHAANV